MNVTRRRLPKIDPQTRKEAILQGMIVARSSILEQVENLPPEQIGVKYLGSWSVMELLAHLTGWDETNRQAIQSLRDAQLPEFYNHRDPDWRSYNAILVDRYRADDLIGLLGSVKESFGRLIRLVESIDPADFDRDSGVRYRGYRLTIARLLEAETRDEQEHARQLNSFLNRLLRDG